MLASSLYLVAGVGGRRHRLGHGNMAEIVVLLDHEDEVVLRGPSSPRVRAGCCRRPGDFFPSWKEVSLPARVREATKLYDAQRVSRGGSSPRVRAGSNFLDKIDETSLQLPLGS